MQVKFKKLHPNAVIPQKAFPTDFGADLTITTRHIDAEHHCVVYGFGIAVEIPEGHVGLIFPRSSNAKKDLLLSNSVGCIDAHYRGEIMAKYKLHTTHFVDEYGSIVCDEDLEHHIYEFETYDIGDRPCQLAILPYPEVEYIEADTLSETDRATGGYGSTGA